MIRIWPGAGAGLVAWFEFSDWVEKGVHPTLVEAARSVHDAALVLSAVSSAAGCVVEQVGESAL